MRWTLAAWLAASLAGTDLPLTPEQLRRQTSVIELAPAPLPEHVPMSLDEGTDADGYPRRYVDGSALRSLLRHRRFDELTRYLEALQTAFEADPRCEYWPTDALEALGTGEVALLPLLDEWARASPRSFAPWAARGVYWTQAAYARRGTRWAAETPKSDFAGMRAALRRAMPDLDRALELRPRVLAAYRAKMNAYNAGCGTDAQMRRAVEGAIAACPSCFLARATYINVLRPRWRGSWDQMAAFAREAEAMTGANPKLRLLRGYVDLDVADVLLRDERYDEALSAANRACALGDHWEFLLGRARIHVRRGDLAAALADLDRAAELRPTKADIFFERALANDAARRWEAAGRDLLAGFRLDPIDAHGRRLLDHVVKGLVYEGCRHHRAGRRADALRVYDLAAALAPTNRDVQARRSAAVMADTGGDDDALAGLEERVRSSPYDFRLHQELDYALAKRRQFDRVVALWTEFLERNPDHPGAHLERGGAFYHLRRYREALADAHKACELGENEGCARARQLRGRDR
jgi:tetratricopeptide (TPR) repeat protein